ncbi:hypothetical protein [Thermosulfurimonas sp. F29]|uniref:NADH-quinone oxidoreductase subunit B family protein n=1 Tax=Thermosulfurimonas sp. F29 TaxID=2867247 RepID=UPI001C82FE26|nr:hypothetical protein [Thermosulfurimonas sp. F29]MBX6424032.1 hypothetical protein [Thermosulfurimonas sp. F29]
MKVALYNALSCGGCDLRFFLEDLPEWLLHQLEVVYWPELGVTEAPERTIHIDIALVCGAIRTPEQERTVRTLRRRARSLVAVGACALYGGIPGLLWEKEEGPRPVSRVVPCDRFIPGCPPEAHTLRKHLEDLRQGKEREDPPVSLCKECPRERQAFRIKGALRITGGTSRKECFLALGIICSGPVTRGGCGAVCIRAGEPCRGCYGPLDPFSGERFLSALASAVPSAEGEEFLRALVDPVGILFRFFLAESPILRIKKEDIDGEKNQHKTP